MADQEVTIKIAEASVQEVREALQHEMGLDRLANAADFVAYTRKQVKYAVYRWRKFQQTQIDLSDPTRD